MRDHKLINSMGDRNSGITLLYETISNIPDEFICDKENPTKDKIAWFDREPENMIEIHKDIYKKYFKFS